MLMVNISNFYSILKKYIYILTIINYYIKKEPKKKVIIQQTKVSRCFYYGVLVKENNDAKLRYGSMLRKLPKSNWAPMT